MTDRRMIAAAVWEDEFVGSLTFFERILWIGLVVTCADDQGRMADNPNVIRSKVYIYDGNVTNEKVEEALQRFVETGKLAKYHDEKGRGYFQLINWWKYQSQQWPQPSKFPAPAGWIDRVRYHTSGRQIVTENWDKSGGFTMDQPVDRPVDSAQAQPLPSGLPNGLGSGLPRRLASPLPRPIEYEEEEEEREEEQERAAEAGELLPGQSVYPEWPRIPDAAVAERVFQQVTGMVTFPGRSRISDIERISAIYDRKQAETVEYIKPFYEAWLKRDYSKINTGWLDWAVAGQVPKWTGQGRKPKPDPDIGTNDPTVKSAFSYLQLNPKGSGREGALKRLRERGWDYVNGQLIKLNLPA